MANQTPTEEKAHYTDNLLPKLTPLPQTKTGILAYEMPQMGRIRRLFKVFRLNYSSFMLNNTCAIIFMLPIIAVIAIFASFGAERVSYLLTGREMPYLMGGLGIGLSSGVSITEIKADTVYAWWLLLGAIAVLLPLAGVGLSGLLYVTQKAIWGEQFISKRDLKTNKDVPRIFIEFFRGVKLYAKQTVLFTTIFAVFFGGEISAICYFVHEVYMHTANVGHYFLLIISSLIFLFATVVFAHLLPMATGVEGSVKDKLKNAFILTLCLPLEELMIIAVCAVPFLLLLIGGSMGSFISIIIVAFAILIAPSLYGLVFTNYSDRNAAIVLSPNIDTSKKGGQQQSKQQNKSRKKLDKEKVKTAKIVLEKDDKPAKAANPNANKANKAGTKKKK